MALVKVQANPELWINPSHVITVREVVCTFPENNTVMIRTVDGHRYILPDGTSFTKIIAALNGEGPVDE